MPWQVKSQISYERSITRVTMGAERVRICSFRLGVPEFNRDKADLHNEPEGKGHCPVAGIAPAAVAAGYKIKCRGFGSGRMLTVN